MNQLFERVLYMWHIQVWHRASAPGSFLARPTKVFAKLPASALGTRVIFLVCFLLGNELLDDEFISRWPENAYADYPITCLIWVRLHFHFHPKGLQIIYYDEYLKSVISTRWLRRASRWPEGLLPAHGNQQEGLSLGQSWWREGWQHYGGPGREGHHSDGRLLALRHSKEWLPHVQRLLRRSQEARTRFAQGILYCGRSREPSLHLLQYTTCNALSIRLKTIYGASNRLRISRCWRARIGARPRRSTSSS